MKEIRFLTIILITVLFMFSLAACEVKSPDGEGFALYLPAHDIPATEMATGGDLEPADEALVSVEEIVAYSSSTHEIELSERAFGELMDLEVPVNGKVFVACVDRQPIYRGAFWTPYSSLSFDGIVILIPPLLQQQHTIRIDTGYPSERFFTGEDPRNDSRIMQSLKHAGKLE